MNKASRAWGELRAMEELSSGDSPVHRLNPSAKLLVTILYIAVTVSFPKYALSALMAMALYPAVLFPCSGIALRTCFYKLRYMLPLVLAVGAANPFFDRAVLITVGPVAISGGVISMVTLMLKGLFSLMASFLLIATTKIDALCASLRKLHVPDLLVTLLLLTYRYLSVMVEQVIVMSEAYALRAPGQRGIHISAWGSFLGQLLLRSMDRATELYQSMLLRGFDSRGGELDTPPASAADWLYVLGWGALFLLGRRVDLAAALGGMLL